jgi:hypothetical protein
LGVEEHIRSGWRYAADGQRVLVWSLVYVAFGVLALAPLVLIAPLFTQGFTPAALLNILGLVAYWFVLFVAFAVSDLFLTGVFIHLAGEQARGRPAVLSTSARAAWSRLPSLVGASLVYWAAYLAATFVTGALGAVGYSGFWDVVGTAATVLIAFAFLFVNYEVMLAGRRAVDAVKRSAELLRREAFRIIALLVALTLVALVAILVVAVACALLVGFALPFAAAGPDLGQFAVAAGLFVLALALVLAGFVFVELLVIGTLASAYLDFTGGAKAARRAPVRRRRR